MNTVPTYWATIYVGFLDRTTDHIFRLEDVARVLQDYCNRVGLCVTMTPTEFIYTNGSEPGCTVGLINYPRFPSAPTAIREHALTLAQLLKDALRQFKVSVVMLDETVMLSTEPADVQESECDGMCGV